MIPESPILSAVITNVLTATVAWLLGTVRSHGVVGGILVGTVIFLAFSWQGWLLLLIFFVSGSAATRWGQSLKEKQGTAQPYQGRRGIGEVISKAGVPFLLAVLLLGNEVWGPWPPSLLLLAYGGSLATALADTFGSELGPLGKGPVWQLPTLKKVKHGTPGGVSLMGLLGACVGAAGIAGAGYSLLQIAFLPVLLAGILASLIDGILSASTSGRSTVTHHAVNFTACILGAVLAVSIDWVLEKGGTP